MMSKLWKLALRSLPIIVIFLGVVAPLREACAVTWFSVTQDVSVIYPTNLTAQSGLIRFTIRAVEAGGGSPASPAGTNSVLTLSAGDGVADYTAIGSQIIGATSAYVFALSNVGVGSYTINAWINPAASPSYPIFLGTLTVTNPGPSLVVNAGGGSGGGTNIVNVNVEATSSVPVTVNAPNTINITNVSIVYTTGVSHVGSLTGAVSVTAAGGMTITTDLVHNCIVFSNAAVGMTPFDGVANIAFFTNYQRISYVSGPGNVWQQWITPAGVTQFIAELWSAGGGGGNSSSAAIGGTGTYVQTSAIATQPGQRWYILVGQPGGYASSVPAQVGGGYYTAGSFHGGAGGGATVLATATNIYLAAEITNVVAIAGGGGGAGKDSAGGAGGTTTGSNGGGTYKGFGATQSAGGANDANNTNTVNASGYLRGGGTAGNTLQGAGSGGGGYYGGGAGWCVSTTTGAGGGGVSFVRFGYFGLNGNYSSHPDWVAGVGVGGTQNSNGGPGQGVIRW